MVGLRICFVTPFAWSQPHDVNDHVAGSARARDGSGTRSPSWHLRTRAPICVRAAGARERASSATSSRSAPRCRSPPQHDGRTGRRPSEPRACARPRGIRRRTRLRAGPAEPLLPGPAGHQGARGRDVLLARTVSSTRPARRSVRGCWPHRRAAGDVPGDCQRGGGALPRRLHGRSRPGSTGSSSTRARGSGESSSSSCLANVTSRGPPFGVSTTSTDGRSCFSAGALAKRPYVPLRLRGPVSTSGRSPPADERAAILNGAERVRPCSPVGASGSLSKRPRPLAESIRATTSPPSRRELDTLYRRLAGAAAGRPCRARSALRSRVDRGRSPHAHVVVARLQRPRRGAARRRRGDRAGRHCDHRPQRLRRRPRGGGARPRTAS